jgi:hypothetical protein
MGQSTKSPSNGGRILPRAVLDTSQQGASQPENGKPSNPQAGNPQNPNNPQMPKPPNPLLNSFMIPHGLVLETRQGPFILSNPFAIKRYKQFDPTHWGVPMPILIMEKITIWGRQWIVKKSKLKGMRLGLFACEDILVVPGSYVDLFPFLGTTYRETSWVILKRHIPHIREYGLTIKTNAQLNITAPQYMDGCPKRSSNIVGYINSNRGFESRRPKTNVQFHV